MCEGGGSWLSHLIIDGKIFWKIEDAIPKWKDDGELSIVGHTSNINFYQSECKNN